MTTNKEFLGTERIGKLLFKLSIPTVIAQLINMLYNIIDRIYIGHMPGDGSLALTGVGVCMPLIMLVSAFAALVSAGGAPRASIFMGKQDLGSAQKTLGNCFSLQMIVSFVLTFILIIWNEDLLLAFGASENTISYATQYMSIYALGTLFVQMTLGMNTFITAQGFTTISMISVLIGAICNIVLDPLFIFGFNLGVKGAAIANFILNKDANKKYKVKYNKIKSRDRVKFYYTTDPLYPVFGFLPGKYPLEYAPSIDYNIQFGKILLEPINKILEILGFNKLPADLCFQNALF